MWLVLNLSRMMLAIGVILFPACILAPHVGTPVLCLQQHIQVLAGSFDGSLSHDRAIYVLR